MKTILFISAFIFCNSLLGQEWEWAKQVNGTANDYVSDIFVDDSANVYITGRSKVDVTFEDPINPITPTNYGDRDAFAAKYDKDGNLIWANLAGSSEPDWGWGIVADNNGYTYFTGEFSDTSVFGNDTIICNGLRDVFISKLDHNGNFVWTKTFGGTESDKGFDIEIDNAGNLYVTGYVDSEVTIGNTIIGTNSTRNAFVVKLDTAGNFIHMVDVAPQYGLGYHLKSDKNGNIYLTGETKLNTYFNNLYEAGVAHSWRDAFLAKMDTSLQTQWVRWGQGSFHNIGESIAVSDNYVYYTGCFSGFADFSGTTLTSNGQGTNSSTHNAGRDMFIAKYDFDGNISWVKNFGGTGFDYSYGIDVTADDHIYIGGIFSDTVMFDTTQVIAQEASDQFFARLTAEGDVVWIKQQGGSLVEFCYAVELDNAENLYAGGSYKAHVYFDSIFMPTDASNGYVGKITQHTYPNVIFADTILCYGDSIALIAEGITSPLTYQFLIDQSIQNSLQANETLYIPADSTILLTGKIIISNNIYSDTISFSQNYIYSDVHPFSLGIDTTICDNDFITLSSPTLTNSLVWSNSDTTSIIEISEAGIFWLNISDIYGCQQSDTIEIQEYNTSAIQFSLGTDTAFCDNDSIQLIGPVGNNTYLWSNNSTSNEIYVYNNDDYWLTVTDSNNCSTSDTISVNTYNSTYLNFDLGNDIFMEY